MNRADLGGVGKLRGSMAANERHFTYKQAGVDVDAGNRAVDLLKERLKSIRHPLVLGGLGGFGGAMRLPPLMDPVLVAGTDGVGTKIELARATGRLDTIGIDLVAMSVNDVSACGAVPLFFLDYLVVGRVVPEEVAAIVQGIDEGCLQAQCALLGGETAEHPGQFPEGDFDLAGFAVGIAERSELWSPSLVQEGDVLIGLASSGLHSNGFSLVRHLLKEHGVDLRAPAPWAQEEGESADTGVMTVGEALLVPTRIYSPVLHDLGHAGGVRAAAHITGGGFPDNVGRVVPEHLAAEIDLGAWRPPPVFRWLHALGVDASEMLNTFNCGIGMVVVADEGHARKHLDLIAKHRIKACALGTVVLRGEDAAVRYVGTLGL